MNDRNSRALQGASAGAKIGSAVPGIGTAIGASVGAIVGALSGGGKGYAQTVGHHVIGTISKSGFSGEFFGTASNGSDNYKIPLSAYNISEIAKASFSEYPANTSIPVQYSGSPDSQTFWDEINALFRNLAKDAGAQEKAAKETEKAAKETEKSFLDALSPLNKRLDIDEGVAAKLATPQESSDLASIVQPQYALLIVAILAALFFLKGVKL